MHYQCSVWHGKCRQNHGLERTDLHRGDDNEVQHISKVAFTENKTLFGSWYISDSFVCSWDSSFLGCLVQPWYDSYCLVLLYLILSCVAVVSWRPVLLWRGNGGGVDPGKTEVVRGTGWDGGRRNCGRDKLYERRRYLQLNNKILIYQFHTL